MSITTQKEFFREWSDRTNVKQKDLKNLYTEMHDMIIASLNESDESTAVLPGIGILKSKIRQPYIAHNPLNNQPTPVELTRRVSFTPKSTIKEAVGNDYINVP